MVERLKHQAVADETLGDALDTVDRSQLTDSERAICREARREHDRAASVDDTLIDEIQETAGRAFPVWAEATENDDFEAFAPILEELVQLRREYAAQIDDTAEPYAVLFAEYEPYLPLETAASVLAELRSELVPLIDAIGAAEQDPPTEVFRGTFDEPTQTAVIREALDLVDFDWDRGRLDTSAHPFSSATQFDARITTRFTETDLLDGLTAALHEFGHASYDLGLPDDAYGSPLGRSREKTIHESQSRFWENHVGRTRAFWEQFLPRLTGYVPSLEDTSAAEAYAAANRVYPDNLIRVEADELTYHLHILVRFEIERALINDELDVAEIPTVWNDKYESYLGVRPSTDATGCLQDVHWSKAYFGYFPTYTLGSLFAAQLNDVIRADRSDIDERIRAGDFEPIRTWLTNQVHCHGQRFTTGELIRRVTGDDLSATPFLNYAREKFGDLYAL